MKRVAKKATKKRIGRPVGRKPLLNLRIEQALLDQLKAAAAQSGRTIAEETISRVQHSFQGDEFDVRLVKEIFGSTEVYGIVRIIAAAMNETGQTAGILASHTLDGSLAWLDNPYAYDQAVQATKQVLEAFRPDGDPSLPNLSVLKHTRIDGSTGDVMTTQEGGDAARGIATTGELSTWDIFRLVGVGFANSKLSEAASGESRVMSPEAQERARTMNVAIGRLAERLAKKGIQR